MERPDRIARTFQHGAGVKIWRPIDSHEVEMKIIVSRNEDTVIHVGTRREVRELLISASRILNF